MTDRDEPPDRQSPSVSEAPDNQADMPSATADTDPAAVGDHTAGTPAQSTADTDATGGDTQGAQIADIDPDALTVPTRSLHPRIRYLWVVTKLIPAAILGVIAFTIDRFVLATGQGLILAVGVGAGVFIIGTVHSLLRYRVWQYEVRDDALYLERGVLTRIQTVVPLVRIQHVDTSRSPIERVLGLSSVVVYTAGSRGADVTIPGLTVSRAEDMQRRLKRLAIVAGGDPAV